MWSVDIQLAGLARRQRVTLLVESRDGAAGQDAADAARMGAGIGSRQLDGDAGLGAAVILVDHRAPPVEHPLLHRSRSGRGYLPHTAPPSDVLASPRLFLTLHPTTKN